MKLLTELIIDEFDSIHITQIVHGDWGVAYSDWWVSSDSRARHCGVEIRGTGTSHPTVDFISNDPQIRQTMSLGIKCLLRNKS